MSERKKVREGKQAVVKKKRKEEENYGRWKRKKEEVGEKERE